MTVSCSDHYVCVYLSPPLNLPRDIISDSMSRNQKQNFSKPCLGLFLESLRGCIHGPQDKVWFHISPHEALQGLQPGPGHYSVIPNLCTIHRCMFTKLDFGTCCPLFREACIPFLSLQGLKPLHLCSVSLPVRTLMDLPNLDTTEVMMSRDTVPVRCTLVHVFFFQLKALMIRAETGNCLVSTLKLLSQHSRLSEWPTKWPHNSVGSDG